VHIDLPKINTACAVEANAIALMPSDIDRSGISTSVIVSPVGPGCQQPYVGLCPKFLVSKCDDKNDEFITILALTADGY